jgi:PTH1 family peptidyl-tRNA hydrolase
MFWQLLTSAVYLWVGLGNPGAKYEKTRHNIGASILRALFPDVPVKMEKSLNAFSGHIHTGTHKYILLFPQTFMNLSGDAVKKALKLFNIKPENMIVLHDEIELLPLKINYKFGGGHRGHNGLRDIIQKISSSEFHRIRIGVGRPVNPVISVADYVLSEIPLEEIPHVKDVQGLLKMHGFWK